jgi:putative redox protein
LSTGTTESRVDVDWLKGDVFLGGDEWGHSIVFDSWLPAPPEKEKRPSRGFGPMNALLTSLGACSGMDVVAILGKRKQKLESLRVEISGKRPQYGFPKPFTDIHLRFVLGGPDLEEKYVKEAVSDSITKYCSVAATVNGKAKISFSYEIVQS